MATGAGASPLISTHSRGAGGHHCFRSAELKQCVARRAVVAGGGGGCYVRSQRFLIRSRPIFRVTAVLILALDEFVGMVRDSIIQISCSSNLNTQL